MRARGAQKFVIICRDCGRAATFGAPGAKRCPECQRIARRKSNRASRQRCSGVIRPRQVAAKPGDLRQLSAEAKAAGMTYGQYVLQMGL